MSLLSELEPKELWRYFEDISHIPRCSGNEESVRRYIVNFAERKGLEYKVDKVGNIVVIKEASKGFESKPTVILQAHMDMVCEKNSNIKHDFEKDPIELKIDKGKLKANGTTLGADNGIGIAAMLAILENKYLKHGKIECLFTVEEETGLKGAMELDETMITGNYMINLDTEEAGVIYIGCAGGIESKIIFRDEKAVLYGKDWQFYEIAITGLKGGHSGGDIDKERANSIKLMTRLLFFLRKKYQVKIVEVKGGDKHNAIPREAFSKIAVLPKDYDVFKDVTDFEKIIIKEYSDVEDRIKIAIFKDKPKKEAFSDRIIDIMMVIPHGVIKMSKRFENLVDTSTNFAAINSLKDTIELHMSHRSLIDSNLQYVMDIHESIATLSGTEISFLNKYPAWEPDINSNLLKLSIDAMKEVYEESPEVKVIHAGLEAAIIKSKFKNMDIISIGPTISDPHSPRESVDISTVKLFWESLIKILEFIK